MEFPLSLSLYLSFTIRPYHLSLLAGPLDRIKSSHGAVVRKFLLDARQWRVHGSESKRDFAS